MAHYCYCYFNNKSVKVDKNVEIIYVINYIFNYRLAKQTSDLTDNSTNQHHWIKLYFFPSSFFPHFSALHLLSAVD